MVNPEPFVAGMNLLTEAFDKEISPALLKAYMAVLRDYDDETFQHAVARTLSSCVHFPRPVELKQFCGGGKDKAFEAWQLVLKTVREHGRYQSVDFADRAINAALRAIGGWVKFCDGNEDALHFAERDFVAAYGHYNDTGVSEERGAYLPGVAEKTNLVEIGKVYVDIIRIEAPQAPKQLPSGEKGLN